MIKLEITDNLIVSDSQIVKDINASMYAIVSVSGSMDSIEYVAEIFKEKLSDKCMSLSSFKEWIEDIDNQTKLLDMLTSLCLDSRRCSFHCYLSDHTYSKFLFVIKSLFPELNLRHRSYKEKSNLYMFLLIRLYCYWNVLILTRRLLIRYIHLLGKRHNKKDMRAYVKN